MTANDRQGGPVAAHDLLAILAALPQARVLVVGDLVLDRYTWGNVSRVSPEAPIMVLEADRRESHLGGAANVANILRIWESPAACIGVIGNDSDGQLVRDLLLDGGIEVEGVLTDPSRPTTTKERFIGRAGAQHPSQVLRVDSEDRTPLAHWLEDAIVHQLSRDITQYDLVLISDYGKGVCTPRVLEAAIGAGRSAEVPVLIDPMRTTDWQRYRGASLLKVNRGEAEAAAQASFVEPRDVLAFGRKLCETFELQSLAITLGSAGTAVVRRDGSGDILSTVAREVYDVSGAGDLVMAVLGVCLAGGVPLEQAAELANVATAIKLERFGVAHISREDLRRELVQQQLMAAVHRVGLANVLASLEPTQVPDEAIAGRISPPAAPEVVPPTGSSSRAL
jgi:D-beta-D-heptose 7-phosphate kinase / D-beta-D-heptose 1-phosphate adenosyltransferase